MMRYRVTLCEHLEVAELGQQIEAACCRAVRTAMRELSDSGLEVHMPRDQVEGMLAQIEALRTTGTEPALV
jgi:hypothetical protein